MLISLTYEVFGKVQGKKKKRIHLGCLISKQNEQKKKNNN